MANVVRLLEDLVALPSINPAFLTDQSGLTGEHRVADFLLSWCSKSGLDVAQQTVLPNRNNVFAKLDASESPKHRLLLAPHMDTASVSSPNELQPRRSGTRLYGRGTCDTKGCIAAMAWALSRVALSGKRPKHTEVMLIGLIDEESGQEGSRAIANSDLKANLAIVGEPTRLQVVTAHKGDVWLHLDTFGKSAHGSTPQLGKNAIHLMAKVVEVLENEYANTLKLFKHPLLGHPTINVGAISGGRQPNIVPDSCRIAIDRRTLPGESLKSVTRELTTLFRRHKLKVSFENMRGGDCIALETDPKQPWVASLMKLVRQTKPVGVNYFCDAAVLASAGIPSIVFGPGDIAQAHTSNEWIDIRSLERGAAYLESYIRSLD